MIVWFNKDAIKKPASAGFLKSSNNKEQLFNY